MKRKKMQDKDVWGLQSNYHDFYRVSDGKGVRGTAFVFDKLTEQDLETIKSFKNTVVSIGNLKYAQEIKNIRLIVLDKIPQSKAV